MSLEADGMITIYDIETGVVIAQYEGLEVHEAMLAMKAAQQSVQLICSNCGTPLDKSIPSGRYYCPNGNCGESR